jgi:hypothetical protein
VIGNFFLFLACVKRLYGDCLEVRAEKDKYMFLPHRQNAGENPCIIFF